MRTPNDFIWIFNALNQCRHGFTPRTRDWIAHRIWHVDGFSARFNHRIKHAHQEIYLWTYCIFGRKFHISRVFQSPFHRLHCTLNHLVFGHAQFVFHMDFAGGNEGMNAARSRMFNRFTRTAHVILAGARQWANGWVFDDFGDFRNSLKIAWAGGGKACFNHVYTQFFKLARNTDFFFFGHGCARALFAIAQGGIKNNNLVLLIVHDFIVLMFAASIFKLPQNAIAIILPAGLLTIQLEIQ